jgi:hypothetical protein
VPALRFLVFIGVSAFAAEADRPRCSEGRLGQFWPIEANFESKVRWQAAHSGTLEICAKTTRRYYWKPVRMNRPRIAVEPPARPQAERVSKTG